MEGEEKHGKIESKVVSREGGIYPNKVSSVRSQNKADRRALISYQMPKFEGDPDSKVLIPLLRIKYPRI